MNKTNMIQTHDLFSDRYDLNHNGATCLKEPLSTPRHGQALTQGKSHHQQHPARRRIGQELPISKPRQSVMSGLSLYIAIAILISCCCTLTSAAAIATELPKKITDPLAGASEELRLALAQLAESGTIVVDTRPPPLPPGGNYWQIENVEREGLLRRQSHNTSSSSNASHPATSTTVAGSAATSSGAPSGTPSPSPLPMPFDSSLGNNFTTQSCPNFITGFLSNDTFKACLPFSLLLEVSLFNLSPPVPN